jgi:outer membrane protein
MKKNICLITGFILISFLLTSTNGYAADGKIGFINIREIIQKSNAGKKSGAELKNLYDKKHEGIAAAEGELKKLKDELDKQATIMTETARRELGTTYQKKLRDYKLMVQDVNDELQKRDQEMFQKLMPGIIKAINNVAEKEKRVAIFLAGVPNAPVAYYSKENDITSKVIDEFNKSND